MTRTPGLNQRRRTRIAALALAIVGIGSCSDTQHHPTATLPETPPLKAMIIRASRDSARLIVGTTMQLGAMVGNPVGYQLPNKQHIDWTSTQPSVASVDPAGLVTGVDTGRALVIAKHKKSSDTVEVHVVPIPVAAIVLDPASLSLETRDTVIVKATPVDSLGRPLAGRVVSWSSSAPDIARVEIGVVAALAPGTATIRASCEEKVSDIIVTVHQASVSSIQMAPTTTTIPSGGVQQFLATALDRKGREIAGIPVTWTVTHEWVAGVSTDGLVTGRSVGETSVTATVAGVHAIATVKVVSGAGTVMSVRISPKQQTIAVWDYTTAFQADARNAAGLSVYDPGAVFRSLDQAIIVMDGPQAGGLAEGTARVVASVDGKEDTAVVTVTKARVAVVTVTVAPSTLPVFGSGCPSYASDALATVSVEARGWFGLVPLSLAGRTVTWSIAGHAITATAGGGANPPRSQQFTGVALGADTIVVSVDGVRGAVAISTYLCSSTSVSPVSATIDVAATLQFTGAVRMSAGTIIVPPAAAVMLWESSDSSVATVTQDGKVTAVAPGTATITATAYMSTGHASVTVRSPPGQD